MLTEKGHHEQGDRSKETEARTDKTKIVTILFTHNVSRVGLTSCLCTIYNIQYIVTGGCMTRNAAENNGLLPKKRNNKDLTTIMIRLVALLLAFLSLANAKSDENNNSDFLFFNQCSEICDVGANQ